MDLAHSVLAPPPVLDALASDAALTYAWLLEAWFIRLRWIALPLCLLAVPFVPRATWPMRLLFPLALALGNGWLVWRLRQAQGGTCLRRVRRVATGLDWALGLLALGMSAGTAAHEAVPAVLLLLMVATALRYGHRGLLLAAVGSASLTALLVAYHVVLLAVLPWDTAAGLLTGWEIMIGLTTLLGWGLLGAGGEWYRCEMTRAARRGAGWRSA